MPNVTQPETGTAGIKAPERRLSTPILTCLSQIYNQISVNINLDALNSNHRVILKGHSELSCEIIGI